MKILSYLFTFIVLFLLGCKTEELQFSKIENISFDSISFHITDEDTVKLNIKFNPVLLDSPKYTIYSDSDKIVKVENGKIIGVDQGTARIVIYIDSIPNLRDTCTVVVRRKKGTADNPILIYSVQELKMYRDLINNQNSKYGDRYYKLMNDLDFLNEDEWISIGGIYPDCLAFSGEFDGNNKIISNLRITKSNSTYNYYYGLFGFISNGVIKNLGVKWNYFNTNYSSAGGIVGLAHNSLIINCYTNGKLISKVENGASNVGGIAGFVITNSKIINCFSTSDIESNNKSGGIIGSGGGWANVGNTSVCVNCFSSGTVLSKGDNDMKCAGGITGGNIFGSISYCLGLNDSIILLKSFYGGTGIIGRITSEINSFNQNYADSSMYVNGSLTDLSNIMKNGLPLKEKPVNLLNSYVSSNPQFNGITLKNWIMKTETNNNFPVFE